MVLWRCGNWTRSSYLKQRLYSIKLHPLRLQVVAFGNREKVSRGWRMLFSPLTASWLLISPGGLLVRIWCSDCCTTESIPGQGMNCFWVNINILAQLQKKLTSCEPVTLRLLQFQVLSAALPTFLLKVNKWRFQLSRNDHLFVKHMSKCTAVKKLA